MPSYDYVKGTITSYEDLRSLAKRHRSLVVHNKEKRKTRVEYLAYEGRLAFVLGLRDPHCLVSSSDADKGDGGAYCQMCHTLVSPSSYDENTEVCVICSILSDAQKVVPKFPEGLSPPLFQEFKDSHSKKHRFDSYGLRWREQKSSAQDAQFLREWRKDKNTVRLVHYYLAEHFNKLRTNRKKEDDIELRYSQICLDCDSVFRVESPDATCICGSCRQETRATDDNDEAANDVDEEQGEQTEVSDDTLDQNVNEGDERDIEKANGTGTDFNEDHRDIFQFASTLSSTTLIPRKRSRQTSQSAAAAAATSASDDSTEATPKNTSNKRHGGTGVSRRSDTRIAMSRPRVHTDARKSSGKKTATQPSSARKDDRSPSKKINGMAGRTGEKSPKRQKYTANPGPLSNGTIVDTDAMEEMVDLLLNNLQALDEDALPAHMKTYATEIWRAATQTQSEFRLGFFLYYVALRWMGTGSDPTTQSLYLVQIQSTTEYLDLCSVRFRLLAAIVAVFAYGVDKKNESEIIEETVQVMVRHLKHHRECNEVQKAVNALEYSCQMIKDMLY